MNYFRGPTKDIQDIKPSQICDWKALHVFFEDLFPKQLLSWMGFSVLARSGLCSLTICWLLLVPAGVPVLVSLLLSSLVPVLVSLLLSSFFPQDRGSVPSWFAGSSWFRLGVPVLVSLLLSSFFPQDRGSVPSWFAGSSWFRLGFRCLSPFFFLLSFLRKRVLFHHDLLVPPGSGWGSDGCLPSSLLFGSGACLPSSSFFSQEKGSVPSWISWFFLLPAGVPVLVSLLLSSLFLRKGVLFLHGFPGSSCFGLGFRCLSPFFSLLSFLNRSVPDSSMNFELHMTLVETWVVSVWGLCWCNYYFTHTHIYIIIYIYTYIRIRIFWIRLYIIIVVFIYSWLLSNDHIVAILYHYHEQLGSRNQLGHEIPQVVDPVVLPQLCAIRPPQQVSGGPMLETPEWCEAKRPAGFTNHRGITWYNQHNQWRWRRRWWWWWWWWAWWWWWWCWWWW